MYRLEMGNCLASCCHPEVAYYISHSRPVAILQSLNSNLLGVLPSIEEEIMGAGGVEGLYNNIITGKIDFSTCSTEKIYAYFGVIGIYYGVDSVEYKNVNENIIKYSSVDAFWLHTALQGMVAKLNAPPTYYGKYDDSLTMVIPDNVTILFIADFATGLERSDRVLSEAKRLYPDISVIVHGGDTYYSGTKEEQENNLLKPLRKYFPGSLYRCIRGNHDIYSGNEGFDYLLNAVGQSASYFSLTNKSLLIQGMDTTMFDTDPILEGKTMTQLMDDEAKWHVTNINEAKWQGKTTIAFSHHEPLTYNDSVGENEDGSHPPVNKKLYNQMRECYPSLDAYFFGHQHNFMLYQDYKFRTGEVLKKPRLIGHGGCSSISQPLAELYVPSKYDTSLFDIPSLIPSPDWRLGTNGTVIDTGFCVLTCKDGVVKASYYNIHSAILGQFLDAKLVYEEIISVAVPTAPSASTAPNSPTSA